VNFPSNVGRNFRSTDVVRRKFPRLKMAGFSPEFPSNVGQKIRPTDIVGRKFPHFKNDGILSGISVQFLFVGHYFRPNIVVGRNFRQRFFRTFNLVGVLDGNFVSNLYIAFSVGRKTRDFQQ